MSIDLNLEPLEATIGAGALIVNDYRITTEAIDGGHRITVMRGSDVQTMDLMDGAQGAPGETGPVGPQGEPGQDAPQESVLYTPQTLTEAQQAQARENIGAADVVAVNELKDDINDFSEKLFGENVYDNSDVEMRLDNTSLSSDGEVVSNSAYVTIKVKVEIGKRYTLLVPNSELTNWSEKITRISMYDSDGKNLGIISNNTSSEAIPTNVDCKYLYFAIYIGSGMNPSNVMVIRDYDGLTITKYIPYDVKSVVKASSVYPAIENTIKDTVNSYGLFYNWKSENYFDYNNENNKKNGYSISSNGGLAAATGYTTCIVEIDDLDGRYQAYRVNSIGDTWTPMTTRIAMYDANGRNLGILTNNTTDAATPTDSRCKYLYFHIYSTSFVESDVMFLKNADGINLYSFIKYDNRKKIVGTWTGKRWLAYGDSITAISNGNFTGHGWARYVNSEYAFGSFYGRGVGGQTFRWNTNTFEVSEDGRYISRGTSADNCKGCFCSWERIEKMVPSSIAESIDLVLIMGGTNDLSGVEEVSVDGEVYFSKPLWSSDYTTDNDWVASEAYNGGDYDVTSFSGALASTIMKLQTRCPNAIIVVATPLSKWDGNNQYVSNGKSLFELSEIIMETARYMGINCIDVNGTCQINGVNFNECISDGTHPYHEEGKKMLAHAIIDGLRKISPLLD